MSDVVVNALIQELYRKTIEAGPEDDRHVTAHPQIKTYLGEPINIPYIVPDNGFHPEVLVTFDFNHKFVLTDVGTEISGQRIISEASLERIGYTLLNYFSYYFEYVLSYGKNWEKSALKNALDQARFDGSPESLSLFINYILNFFITNITVTRTIGQIGTCSVSMRDTANFKSGKKFRLLFDRAFNILNQLFVPMIPMMVWARGRLYKDWYIPIFDGYITSASDSNSQGFYEVTLNCRDTLELSRFTHEMVTPAIIPKGEMKTQHTINIFSKPFYGIDHFQIVQSMFMGGAIKWDPAGRKMAIFEIGVDQAKIEQNKKSGLISFGRIGNFLPIFDAPGKDGLSPLAPYVSANWGPIYEPSRNKSSLFRKLIDKTKHTRLRHLTTWGSLITPYRQWNTKSTQVFTAEFQSRLDILQETAARVYYDLYVDGYGNVQYHPKRLSKKFLKYDVMYKNENNEKKFHERNFPGAQVIGPEEIFSSSSIMNIEGLVTHLRLSGQPIVTDAPPEVLQLVGKAVNEDLMSRFGYRRRAVNNPMFNIPTEFLNTDGTKTSFFDAAADSLLTFMNAELYTRQDLIVFRPELEIASPLCIIPEKEIFYVQSLTHSIPFGGQATTSISSNMGRSEKEMAPDLGSFIIDSENMYRTHWKTTEEVNIKHKEKVEKIDVQDSKVQELYDKKSKDIVENLLEEGTSLVGEIF